MSLGEFLKSASARPWKWGEHDCCALPARWLGLNVPPYSSEAEAKAMIAEAGGLVRLWDEKAPSVAYEVDEPEPGDVGIIHAVGLDGAATEIGAIWNGRRWSFVPARGGIAGASATAIKIWRPFCPRL